MHASILLSTVELELELRPHSLHSHFFAPFPSYQLLFYAEDFSENIAVTTAIF